MSSRECPTVSIVTPVLNQGQFIEQAIQSVRGQEYSNLEHIVVDGGSSDSTLSILERYEGTYNMRWISEPDNGMYQAINKGMRKAKGEIFAYLNADDLYLPWTLRTVVEEFQRKPSADLVYGDMVNMAMNGQYASIIFNPPKRALRTHLRFLSLAQPVVFWRRRVFESLEGFDESLQIASDYDFWLNAASRFRFEKVDEILAIFRFHSDSKSLRSMADLKEETALVTARYHGQNSTRRVAEQLLYELLWARYHTARLFLLYTKRAFDRSEGEAWYHLLHTKALLDVSIWELCATFIPGLTCAIMRGNPDFGEGHIDANRLLQIAIASAGF
jgi:glycosyltransferase involved in cell wall biosynthesis